MFPFVSQYPFLYFILEARKLSEGSGFDGLDFVQAAEVTLLAGKFRPGEGPHAFGGQGWSNHARSEHQDIHVIVFHALVSRIRIMTQTGPDATHFVGGHGSSDPAPADEHATVSAAIQNRLTDGFGKIRIVHRIGIVGSNVNHFIAQFTQEFGQSDFQFKSGMVGTNRGAHVLSANRFDDLFFGRGYDRIGREPKLLLQLLEGR
jgi:hypothetical protein